MTIETIKQYPRGFQTECREVSVQLQQGVISLTDACRKIIALDAKYEQKLNSWVALVNGDARRGTPEATTHGISEAVETAREELQAAGRKVLPA